MVYLGSLGTTKEALELLASSNSSFLSVLQTFLVLHNPAVHKPIVLQPCRTIYIKTALKLAQENKNYGKADCSC